MEISGTQKKFFTKQLVRWHATANTRDLPWKEEKDPYKIWLSEIILQQTRAQQGLPYYLRFIETYPTVKDLASAADEKVFRLWQGLGYYNRCKNMLATARQIVKERRGKFPENYEQLLALKGVGAYTAAAIASFAYGLPYAVVDGNVYRVLSRYFGIMVPFDTTTGKKIFSALAQELLDMQNSANYNQAIMDLGATVCTPKLPLCKECPLQKNCIAYHQLLIPLLPIKSKKLTVKKRYFNYLLIFWNDKLWLHKRENKDIWENLHEPYLIESSEPFDIKTLYKEENFKKSGLQIRNIHYKGQIRQKLTHQHIESRFFEIKLKKKIEIDMPGGIWLPLKELKKVSFPKTIVSFLENNLYF